MLSCTIDISAAEREIERFHTEIVRGLVGVVQETCLDGAEHARTVGAFKDQTGELRASIKAFPTKRTERGAEGRFGTTLKRGLYVEGGTRAHEIRARRAQALRWEDAGGVHFAQRVQHPGTSAKPFMGPGYLKAQGAILAHAERHVARVIAMVS